MERIVVNYVNGNVEEFIEPSGQVISGNSLIITTKKSVSNDDGDDNHAIITSKVIDLSTVRDFTRIIPTKKYNIEENVSGK